MKRTNIHLINKISKYIAGTNHLVFVGVVFCLLALSGFAVLLCGDYDFMDMKVFDSDRDTGTLANDSNSVEEDQDIDSVICRVISITDGDTIKILYNGNEEKVRLLGIDTPERKECLNKEATNRMVSLVEGKQVRVEFDETQGARDRYNRILLYVWQADIFVNETMIREGFAHEYTYRLPYKYQKQFQDAEKEARENARGLWGDTCGYLEESDTSQLPETSDLSENACDCSKTCAELSSCEDAYFQLDICKCTNIDGDGDGIPCEQICP